MPPNSSSSAGTAAAADSKLTCRSVWKVFGDGAERFLAEHDDPGIERFAEAGLIPAVRDATFEVRAGEIFIVRDVE